MFLRKLKKTSEKKNWDIVERLHQNMAKYSLDTIYYQAEIKGQTVTWIVPQSFGFVQQPQPSQAGNNDRGGEEDMEDRVAALNQSLFKTVVEEEEEQLESITVGDEEKHLEAEKEREARER